MSTSQNNNNANMFAMTVLRLVIPLILIFGAYKGFEYLVKTKPPAPSKARAEKTWPVETYTVKVADFQPNLNLYGEAISGRQVDLRALVAGEIIETGDSLKSGGVLSKGDLLLKIDPFKYKGALVDAEARLSEAKAKLKEIKANIVLEQNALKFQQEQLVLAKRDLERASSLSQKGTVSKKLEDDRRLIVSQRQQSVAQRKSTLEIQKAKLTQQEATIRRLEWGVSDAKKNLKDTTLVSPFDAYVSSVTAEVGRIVSANDKVATLFDQNWIDVRFTLSDSQYGRILSSGSSILNRDVTVKWRVSEPPLIYKASIERVSSEITSDSGGVEVYARISDPLKKAPIRPGTFVEIQVPDRFYKNIIRLPQTALFNGKHVYVIKEGRLKKRDVKLVGTINNQIIVRGDFKNGELILTTRLSTVGEGVKVRPLRGRSGNKAVEQSKSVKADGSLNLTSSKTQ